MLTIALFVHLLCSCISKHDKIQHLHVCKPFTSFQYCRVTFWKSTSTQLLFFYSDNSRSMALLSHFSQEGCCWKITSLAARSKEYSKRPTACHECDNKAINLEYMQYIVYMYVKHRGFHCRRKANRSNYLNGWRFFPSKGNPLVLKTGEKFLQML